MVDIYNISIKCTKTDRCSVLRGDCRSGCREHRDHRQTPKHCKVTRMNMTFRCFPYVDSCPSRWREMSRTCSALYECPRPFTRLQKKSMCDNQLQMNTRNMRLWGFKIMDLYFQVMTVMGRYSEGPRLGLGLWIGLGLAFLKDLCDNNAHQN